MKKIYIIDYGYGNLFSLAKAISYVGGDPVITASPDTLSDAAALILPGVGAFGDGIAELRKRGFEEPLHALVKKGTPLLGICLGMQFLFEKSYEFGEHRGLGFLPGVVDKIAVKGTCKIPHMGWNSLLLPRGQNEWGDLLLQGVREGNEVYFVHSYVGFPEEEHDVIANTCYCGVTMPAVVARGNVFGVQFHPEKSGVTGIQILRNFVERL